MTCITNHQCALKVIAIPDIQKCMRLKLWMCGLTETEIPEFQCAGSHLTHIRPCHPPI